MIFVVQAGAGIRDVCLSRGVGGVYEGQAANNGHEAVVRALIELGADVNQPTDNGWTRWARPLIHI